MKLYHGTNSDFTGICLEKSKLGKDFGSGFYLTPKRLWQKGRLSVSLCSMDLIVQ